jgi:pimeloyl-ACP methyl ester carboxylesterase
MTTLLILIGALCALPLAGALYQIVGSRRDALRFKPPGKLVDVGRHRLHVQVAGSGSPIVMLEAGIAASSVSWEPVRREAQTSMTVYSYDRAGLGWSEASNEPSSIENGICDLKTILESQGIARGTVLVGHSWGGLAALEYACRNRGQLAGLVLVDPLPASEWCPLVPEEAAKLRRGVALARRGAWLARLGVVRLSLDLLQAGSRRIPKLAAGMSARGGGSKLTERLVGEVRKLPRDVWPVIQSHWCQTKSFESMASHLESLPESAAACRTDCDLGDLPLVVLSASDSTSSRLAEHRRMARLSTRGEILIAERSGHWIQLDQPDLVVDAIRKVAAISSSDRIHPQPPLRQFEHP